MTSQSRSICDEPLAAGIGEGDCNILPHVQDELARDFVDVYVLTLWRRNAVEEYAIPYAIVRDPRMRSDGEELPLFAPAS